MRFIQIAHAITKDDAASRQLLNMDAMLRELGYTTEMFAHKVDDRLVNQVKSMEAFSADREDIVIYHMTTGTSFNAWVANYPHKIVLFYHNITPAKFFFGNAWGSWWKCIKGRRQLKKIVKNSFFAWGASEYSRKELESLGLKHTRKMSIVVEPDKYTGYAPVQELVNKYDDGVTTLLMVGRGVPHKKLDEAIEAVAWYTANISTDIRLVLAGNIKPSYGKRLHKMVKELDVTDNVIFTGQISNEELCTWYRLTDVVLSLSEHEGFCVPLVEGMIFDKPVVAYDCSAVPETLGEAGVLIKEKSPRTIATTIHQLLGNEVRLAALKKGRKKRLQELSYSRLMEQFRADIEEIIQLKAALSEADGD
ncbi:glycosyltransferase family 4 protein [uncultured Anaerovibrio sp.]|uniref:glycosyltransferase family 4 protein n=1 Tax=uncultured Anaerovibrio sp. TaxID=361586 RepID=UPI002626AFC6|nr:glycosyltransferase family 4 protein [uncultured Anaerovibrio sp.]